MYTVWRTYSESKIRTKAPSAKDPIQREKRSITDDLMKSFYEAMGVAVSNHK